MLDSRFPRFREDRNDKKEEFILQMKYWIHVFTGMTKKGLYTGMTKKGVYTGMTEKGRINR